MAPNEKIMYLNQNIKQVPSKRLVYMYTFFAIASTLFELYGISYSLNTFTWRFASVIFFSFFALLNVCANGFRIYKDNIYFLPFLISVFGSFLANYAIGSENFELRLIRFIFLFNYAVFLSPRYFNAVIAMNIYKWILWIATVVLLIQVIAASFWGMHISGHLNLPLRSSIYANVTSISRFYSIFAEPGYYGIFASTYLCIKLGENKINLLEMLIIAIALLLSTSTSNIGVLIFIMTYYILFIKSEHGLIKSIAVKMSILVVGGISSLFFLYSEQFNYVSMRLESGYSMNARLEGYVALDSFFKSHPLQVLLGNGMEWYPISGYATLIIVFGVFGLVFYLIGVIGLLKNTNQIGKFILFTFLFLNIGNVEFLGNASSMLIVYPFVLWYCYYPSSFQNNNRQELHTRNIRYNT